MFNPFEIPGDDEIDFSGENLKDGIPVDLLSDCHDDSFMFDDDEVYLSRNEFNQN